MIHRYAKAFQYVGASRGLVEPEAGPPLHHFHLLVEVVAEGLRDAHRAGDPIHQGDHVHPEGALELGPLVELVLDDFGDGALLQFNDQSGADPRR